MTTADPTAPAIPVQTADSSAEGTTTLDSLVPYVAPFVVYMGFNAIETRGWLGLGYEGWYCLKILTVAVLLVWYRRSYPAFSTRGLGWGIVGGFGGIVVWLGLTRLQSAIPGLDAWIASVLGERVGFNPFGETNATPAEIAFVLMRLSGLALLVPVMEEVFWRGFLARYLINNERFRSVPQGLFTPSSFAIVTAAFVSVHPELLAATAWGILINLLYQKTQNLWACVVMHAVTNACLGAWILLTADWKLW